MCNKNILCYLTAAVLSSSIVQASEEAVSNINPIFDMDDQQGCAVSNKNINNILKKIIANDELNINQANKKEVDYIRKSLSKIDNYSIVEDIVNGYISLAKEEIFKALKFCKLLNKLARANKNQIKNFFDLSKRAVFLFDSRVLDLASAIKNNKNDKTLPYNIYVLDKLFPNQQKVMCSSIIEIIKALHGIDENIIKDALKNASSSFKENMSLKSKLAIFGRNADFLAFDKKLVDKVSVLFTMNTGLYSKVTILNSLKDLSDDKIDFIITQMSQLIPKDVPFFDILTVIKTIIDTYKNNNISENELEDVVSKFIKFRENHPDLARVSGYAISAFISNFRQFKTYIHEEQQTIEALVNFTITLYSPITGELLDSEFKNLKSLEEKDRADFLAKVSKLFGLIQRDEYNKELLKHICKIPLNKIDNAVKLLTYGLTNRNLPSEEKLENFCNELAKMPDSEMKKLIKQINI